MKDLGALKYFLGIEVARKPTGIYLCQRKYTLEITAQAGLIGTKPVSTLMEPNPKLAKSNSDFFYMPNRYCRVIGKLIYLTLTRLDVA